MYDYSIYWIKEEISNHYFHKSDILYRFFKEYQNNQNNVDLRNQYLYITNDFDKEIIISHIKNYLKDHVRLHINKAYLEIYNNKQYISLHIGKKQLKFRSGSLQDAEDLLFPMLRIFQPFLFVVGNTHQNYGWISPMKIPRGEQRTQVLYSCR
ncbi:sporulation inhibitor of replication protein SirA [Oceanobacillus salinisoli]|uniref:sporulation inhibitor of replication protein SirA n=1 Tax=Oceanobacillus salinisoli TaxID=2678611 RepID=UPI0012E1D679|nr:sporulation inhibitor of replication protein SirA [Oceanobacillus salinisoli]